MARRSEIPEARVGILAPTALLQPDTPLGIKDTDLHGAVAQLAQMHLAAWRDADHLVSIVNHRQQILISRGRVELLAFIQ